MVWTIGTASNLCNSVLVYLSGKFVEHGTFFFNHMKELELSCNCAKRQIKTWGNFFSTVI